MRTSSGRSKSARPRKVSRKRRREQSVAVLSIFGAGRMTAAGREQIVSWLRYQAHRLKKDGGQYTKGRYTARYISR